MLAVLLSASIAVPAPPAGTADAAKSLDGTWTVVCLEKNGQPQPDAKDMTVKAEGNTITCNGKDGKAAMTWQVSFAQEGKVRVTEISSTGTAADGTRGKESKAGTYIMTSDYLAICLHNEDQQNRDSNNAAAAADGSGPQTKSKCTIILKRDGAR